MQYANTEIADLDFARPSFYISKGKIDQIPGGRTYDDRHPRRLTTAGIEDAGRDINKKILNLQRLIRL